MKKVRQSWGWVLLDWVLLLAVANARAEPDSELTGYWVIHDGSAVVKIEREQAGPGFRVSVASVLREHTYQGLVLAEGLQLIEGQFRGKLLESLSGHTYHVRMRAAEDNFLEVRAFIGFSVLGQTTYWQRLNTYREQVSDMLEIAGRPTSLLALQDRVPPALAARADRRSRL